MRPECSEPEERGKGKIREVSGENHVGSVFIGPWKGFGFYLNDIRCYWRAQDGELTCSDLF